VERLAWMEVRRNTRHARNTARNHGVSSTHMGSPSLLEQLIGRNFESGERMGPGNFLREAETARAFRQTAWGTESASSEVARTNAARRKTRGDKHCEDRGLIVMQRSAGIVVAQGDTRGIVSR